MKTLCSSDKAVVDVLVISYNQEQYISDCLSSILKQKTSFKYRIIIGDDFSSDGTRAILLSYKKRYPEVISLIFQKENVGITRNYKTVYEASSASYIAICEGDDFWIDEHKLQIQVDFLESHKEYGFIGARDKLLEKDKYKQDTYYIDSKTSIESKGPISLFGDVFRYAIYGPVTRTATICFRRELILPYIDKVSIGDYTLQAVLASSSYFARVEKEFAVYRTGSGISSHYSKKYEKYYRDNLQALSELFPSESTWLIDRKRYSLLKEAYYSFDFNTAKALKESISSVRYRNKRLVRRLKGKCSFFAMAVLFRIKLRLLCRG